MNVATARTRIWTVLLIIVVLPIVAVTIFTPSYQTNDDVAMRLIAEGNFVPGDKPLPYLMFINVIIGKILAIAYTITAAVPWYDILLGTSMIAAAAALTYVWTGTARKSEILWTVLLATFFLIPTFVQVQFSFAGLACAAAGIALILRALLIELDPRTEKRQWILGIALFAWGSLIRMPGAALVSAEALLLALPFLIGVLFTPSERVRLRAATLAVIVAVALAAAGFAINQYAYRQAKGWDQFFEYNVARLRIAEYVQPEVINEQVVSRMAREVGWSQNDFALFRNWFFTDPQLFSLERLHRVERLFFGAANRPTEDWKKARMERGLTLGKEFYLETRLAFALMAIFVLAFGARPKLFAYFIYVAVMIGVLMVAISLAFKAPPLRIFWPMLIMAMTMLALAAQRWGKPSPWPVQLIVVVAAIVVIAEGLPALKKQSDERRLKAQIAREDVVGLRRTGASIFILHGNAFPYEDFWTPLHTESAPFDFIGLGVSARTPPVQDSLAATGRGDLPRSLCTEPSMVIIAAPYVTQMLTTFVAEHHKMQVDWVESFHGKSFSAWKCRRIQ